MSFRVPCVFIILDFVGLRLKLNYVDSTGSVIASAKKVDIAASSAALGHPTSICGTEADDVFWTGNNEKTVSPDAHERDQMNDNPLNLSTFRCQLCALNRLILISC